MKPISQNQKQQRQESVTTNKKTRDLPNVSECHSCGFRVDGSAGKNNRLQPLYSEWRIVLLCKTCISQVDSSLLCSYCFKQSCNNNSLRCSQCNHLVHKTCISKQSSVPPWSYYSCSSSQLWVCLDCWVPKLVATKREIRDRSHKRKRNKKCLEVVVKDACGAMEKKIEAALRARELAVAKALVARRDAELARNALELVANTGGVESSDDGIELVIRLCQSVNGASAVLKNFSSANSSCLAVRRMGEDIDGPFANPRVCAKLEVCNGKIISYPLVYARMRRSAKVGNMDVRWEGEGSCSNKLMNSTGDDNSTNPGSQCYREGCESMATEVEGSDGNHDRYFIKYCRRKLNGKSVPNGGPSNLNVVLQEETQPSAVGVVRSCSKESVTFSNSSMQSCTFYLQASSSSSGLSRG